MENNEHSFTFTVSDSNTKRCGKNINDNLLVDTGATSHIINDRSKFIAFDRNFDPSSHVIELADGSNVVTGKGDAKGKIYDVNGNSRDVILKCY